MSTEIIPAPESTIKELDSLVANEFVLYIEDQKAEGIFRISGLVSFKLEVKTTNTLKRVHEPIKVTKMVQRDPMLPFNAWIRDTFAAGDDIVRPTRTLSIVAVDDGVATRHWTINKAWISEISYSEFNSASAEMVEETISIRHEGIVESWPLLEG
jgi:hypothetical protein